MNYHFNPPPIVTWWLQRWIDMITSYSLDSLLEMEQTIGVHRSDINENNVYRLQEVKKRILYLYDHGHRPTT